MDITHQLLITFCKIDDFYKEFELNISSRMLAEELKVASNRGPNCQLSVSEIMTILVMFQRIGFRNFKTFYKCFLQNYLHEYFPNLPSYHRFIAIMPRALFPLTVFAYSNGGSRKGIYYIDSSCLPVCHLKRQKRHKTFRNTAKFGRTSFVWFYGLKLHIVTNGEVELTAYSISKENSHDSKEAHNILKGLKGVAFGDKGYISKNLYQSLLGKGLKLITRKRKNMKKEPLSDYENQLLKQRNLVETVINHLKHYYQIWHSRHRSPINAMTHLVAALSAYAIEPLKLSAIKLLNN